MTLNWHSLYSDNLRDYDGYTIGKIFKYLDDPEIISLAGGLPSPDMFLTDEVRDVSKTLLENDIENILQYRAVPGEKDLIQAVVEFLKRDNIAITENNVLITTSGQHGLDLTGRLFLNPGDSLILDRPTFAGAIVAFQMQRPKFIGFDIQADGTDISVIQQKLENLKNENKPKFIYVVPDFQNPSGITMSLEKRQALLDLSYEFNIQIVEDNPYLYIR